MGLILSAPQWTGIVYSSNKIVLATRKLSPVIISKVSLELADAVESRLLAS